MTLQEWCLQYSEWRYICDSVKLGGGFGSVRSEPEWKDFTNDTAYIWEQAKRCVELVEECCKEAGGNKADDILLVVTEDIPPEYLGVSEELYGRFFDILSYRLQLL